MYLQEIQDLKRSRPLVAHAKAMEGQVNRFSSLGGDSKENLASINADGNALRVGRSKIREVLAELMEGR
eukprot:10616890-Heterocapsa_arctica.AAC.1